MLIIQAFDPLENRVHYGFWIDGNSDSRRHVQIYIGTVPWKTNVRCIKPAHSRGVRVVPIASRTRILNHGKIRKQTSHDRQTREKAPIPHLCVPHRSAKNRLPLSK